MSDVAFYLCSPVPWASIMLAGFVGGWAGDVGFGLA